MQNDTKEKILIPLRELYRRDKKNREKINIYAHSLKKYGKLTGEEFNFLLQRLYRNKIKFDVTLLRSVLSEPPLTVELVPQTCWFSNVRDHVNESIWDQLRNTAYKAAEYYCEICGGQGEKWPLECHEVWEYRENKHIQILKRLSVLCPSCHEVKHIGHAEIRGRGEAAKQHLSTVNNWNSENTEEYLQEVWGIWEKRSRYKWKLDLTWLEKQGIKVEAKR